jgi:hypothetical protein
MYSLGVMYATGAGVAKNGPLAMQWAGKAAERGNVDAQVMLGLGYTGGVEGVLPDYRQAADWLGKASSQGSTRAQVGLGLLYENGSGVNQDLERARALYSQAAQSSDPQIAKLANERGQQLDSQRNQQS